MKVAHITNGDCYNDFFEKNSDKIGIPFSEALIQGKVIQEVFSEESYAVRARGHGISILEYKERLASFMCFTHELEDYSEIYLYFGSDTFCHINMLAILAFLEQKHYAGNVFYMLIDEGNFTKAPLRSPIVLGGYCHIYQQILLNKVAVCVEDAAFQKAYNLYFDYISEYGELAQFIKKNRHLHRKEMLKELFAISKDYGLGDVQLLELIDKYQG